MVQTIMEKASSGMLASLEAIEFIETFRNKPKGFYRDPKFQVEFLRGIIAVAAISPLSQWGVGQLGTYIESVSTPIDSLTRVLLGRQSRLEVLPEAHIPGKQWDIRVIPLTIQQPGPIKMEMVHEYEFTELFHDAFLPKKQIETRLFVDKVERIIAVDLYKERAEGRVLEIQHIEVGLADDKFLIELFSRDTYFGFMMKNFQEYLLSVTDDVEERLKRQRFTHSAVCSVMLAAQKFSGELMEPTTYLQRITKENNPSKVIPERTTPEALEKAARKIKFRRLK